MVKNRKAYSLVEMILIVLFIGVFAAIAVPRFDYALISKHKAETTAWKLVTDLRRTRRMAISDAANNVTGYRLNMVSPSPYTGYEIENLDTGAIIDSHTIDSAVSCTGNLNFKFGPLGNLTNPGQHQMTVAAEGKSFTITIISATGAIQCVEN